MWFTLGLKRGSRGAGCLLGCICLPTVFATVATEMSWVCACTVLRGSECAVGREFVEVSCNLRRGSLDACMRAVGLGVSVLVADCVQPIVGRVRVLSCAPVCGVDVDLV